MGSDTRTVAVAGETIVDLVAEGPGGPYLALPGGSPANVAVGLARLGVPVRMLARVGGDPFGRLLRAHLERNGVGTEAVVRADEPSSVAFVHYHGGGPPAFDLRLEGTADWQWTDAELRGRPGGDVADPAVLGGERVELSAAHRPVSGGAGDDCERQHDLETERRRTVERQAEPERAARRLKGVGDDLFSVRDRDESGLERGRRQVHAAAEHAVKEAIERRDVAHGRLREGFD